MKLSGRGSGTLVIVNVPVLAVCDSQWTGRGACTGVIASVPVLAVCDCQ
jgi:hypothetical protein